MKPEIYKLWEEALSSFDNAEKLTKERNYNEAEKYAASAFVIGIKAIIELSKEMGIDDLNVIAGNAFGEWVEREPEFEMGGKHHTPKENIDWARKVLKRLSDELPPDTLRPFE